MLAVYGLKNCDTCRKARRWLDDHGIAHRFHDLRGEGIGQDVVAGWIAAVGANVLLNRRGTTWRGLSDAEKQVSGDAEAAVLMAEHPALIKRPVFETPAGLLVGFGEAERAALEALAQGAKG